MLKINGDKITKSGVILNDRDILKYIDEPFLVEKDGVLKKEITLEGVKNILCSYPSLLNEYKYLEELIIRSEALSEDKETKVDYMMMIIEHIEGNKKIESLYAVERVVEYATTFIKLKDLYKVDIRYGINRVFDIVNEVEVLIKEYDDDVSLNSFLNTLNVELDFLTDEEIDNVIEDKRQ